MKPLDWFAPIGICTAGAGLCVWGAIISSGPALIVCSITASILMAIVVAFVAMRLMARKPDYILSAPHVKVVLGDFNRPARDQVTNWIQRVIVHWANQRRPKGPLPQGSVIDALNGTTIFYLDNEKLTSWGRAVRGYTQGKDVVVGNTIGHIESLTVHELSHVVLDHLGIPWNEKSHHDLFTSTKLGA